MAANNVAKSVGHISRKASCPQPNMDFVSADVNEVLQDAREILTNKEHREKHPNERILDESTTVKVTKTGGDEDPMEITVLRQRLLERDEEEFEAVTADRDDRGWSSDTDLVSPPQRTRLPSIHKCSHNNKKVQSSGNLPEEMV
ncbi:unnamed protein product [Meloidogyne enterolobii]|uniref:Uncharacterized protein n=1 Tax=Meloidogyne enterolobii TaxID=390850 RepID=A0ACB1AZR2_MELEN